MSDLILSVTRIETWNSGDPTVHAFGTGFFLRYEWDSGKQATEFLVTNRHVVTGWDSGGFYIHRGTKSSPNQHPALWIAAEDWRRSWSFHPEPNVDVGVMNVSKLVPWFKEHAPNALYGALGPRQYATVEAESYFNSVEDVTVLGFPIGILDRENLFPIVRRGSTATPPTFDVDGESAFLIDAPIFPGCSGSPVLIAQEGSVVKIDNRRQVAMSRLVLLGVVSRMYFHRPMSAASLIDVPVTSEGIPEGYTPLNLAYVIKLRRVLETVEAFMRRRGEVPTFRTV